MLNGEFKSYWSETASYETIVPLINMDFDGLKSAVIEMLSGAEVKVNTATFKNDTVNIQNRDEVLILIKISSLLYYNHIDPSFLTTTITVLKSILTSNPISQFSIYSLSNLTTSSKSVMSLLPLTCHIPVIPGLIASRAL